MRGFSRRVRKPSNSLLSSQKRIGRSIRSRPYFFTIMRTTPFMERMDSASVMMGPLFFATSSFSFFLASFCSYCQNVKQTEKHKTTEEPFEIRAQSQTEVPLMSQTGDGTLTSYLEILPAGRAVHGGLCGSGCGNIFCVLLDAADVGLLQAAAALLGCRRRRHL